MTLCVGMGGLSTMQDCLQNLAGCRHVAILRYLCLCVLQLQPGLRKEPLSPKLCVALVYLRHNKGDVSRLPP